MTLIKFLVGFPVALLAAALAGLLLLALRVVRWAMPDLHKHCNARLLAPSARTLLSMNEREKQMTLRAILEDAQ